MAATANSIWQTQQYRIEEIINKDIDWMLPDADPAYLDTFVSNQATGNANELGRDMKIIKVYMGSLAGNIRQGYPSDDFVLYGDNQNAAIGSKLFKMSLSNTFPDPRIGVNAKPYRLAVGMRSMISNLMLTMGELQLEATPSVIGDVIVPKMRGFARHWVVQLCNYWYLSQNNYYKLATIVDKDAQCSVENDEAGNTGNVLVIDLTTSANGTDPDYLVHRFHVGMMVEIFNSGAASDTDTALAVDGSGTDTVFVVVAVDYLSGKIKLQNYDAPTIDLDATSTTFLDLIEDGDYIVFAGSTASAASGFTGIAGINSWMKFGDSSGGTSTSSNTLLGDEADGTDYINVNVHPEFKSLQMDLSGAPLTEHYLRKVLARWHAAKSLYNKEIDCLIASEGVWLAYEAQLINRQWLNRTNMLSSLGDQGSTGGAPPSSGFSFTFEGRTYKGYTSSYIEDGTIYGLKKGGGNWKRYSPPDPRGVRRDSDVPSFAPFRFVAPLLTGGSSNFMPIFDVSGGAIGLPTEGIQLPGMLRMQLVPDQPDGLKIINAATDRIYSST